MIQVLVRFDGVRLDLSVCILRADLDLWHLILDVV